jgi:hypothetical protein
MRKDKFFDRHKSLNLDKSEVERKWKAYLREKEEMELFEAMGRSGASVPPGAVGGGSPGGNGIEFVVDTTNDTFFGMTFTSTGEPITFTIDWGDGTFENGSGYGGFYEETHTFPESNQQYVVKIVWDDPAKILQLEFYGTD